MWSGVVVVEVSTVFADMSQSEVEVSGVMVSGVWGDVVTVGVSGGCWLNFIVGAGVWL